MPVHDFKCLSCGRVHKNSYFSKEDYVGKEPQIECKNCHGNCTVHYEDAGGGTTTDYRFDNPALYGKPYPCFGGIIVRDKAHYMELCRKYDVEPSADRVGGMDPMENEIQEKLSRNEEEKKQRKKLEEMESAQWHPSQDEIMEHFQSDIVH